jgi:hypothetical protein
MYAEYHIVYADQECPVKVWQNAPAAEILDWIKTALADETPIRAYLAFQAKEPKKQYVNGQKVELVPWGPMRVVFKPCEYGPGNAENSLAALRVLMDETEKQAHA